MQYISRESIDTLKVSLAVYSSDPAEEAEQALEELVRVGIDPSTPYDMLAASLMMHADVMRHEVLVAAGHVLALGRRRTMEYSGFLELPYGHWTVLDELRAKDPALRDGIDELESEDPRQLLFVAFYFEQQGEFSLAAHAARRSGDERLGKMYESLASLQQQFDNDGPPN